MHPLFTGKLQIEHVEVAIANLPSHLEGIRVVQLTDLHYDGWRLSEALLEEAIAATNAANPHLIVLTGDYVSQDPTPAYPLSLRLKNLKSQAGIFAILGNHDYYYPHSKSVVTQALTQVGIQVLSNEIVYPLGPELALIGLPDLWSGEFQPDSIFPFLDFQIPRIVLSHNPDTAELLQNWRIDLQLSGHTHGGQIVFPWGQPLPAYLNTLRRKIPDFLTPFIPYKSCHKVFQHWEWRAGFHPIGQNFLYVNRGLGTYFPGRFNCPPEVSVITLVKKN